MNARSSFRNYILGRDHDPKLANVRARLLMAESVNDKARELYDTFSAYGVKWSACVQAVKTDWVSQFLNKWGEIRKDIKSKEKDTKKKEGPANSK